MCISAFSADGPSMMSQPERSASAPRLAPPRRNSRRVGSGRSLAASLIRSFGSTPGMDLRRRGITDLSTADDHGAQAPWYHECHDHMDNQKADDRRHGEEMHEARGIVAAEQRGQLLKLHRLPDRKPGSDDDDPGNDHTEVKELLHGVVNREIVMGEPAFERRVRIRDHLAGADRQELAAEAAGQEPEHEIDEAIDREHPHRREMPEQRAGEPAAERDAPRERERK